MNSPMEDSVGALRFVQVFMKGDLPPDARAKLPDMLCASGVESPQWWWDVLVGDGDPLYRELEPLS